MQSRLNLLVVTGCLIMASSTAEQSGGESNAITAMVATLVKQLMSSMVFDNKPLCADAAAKIVSLMTTSLVPDVLLNVNSASCFGMSPPSSASDATDQQAGGSDPKRSVGQPDSSPFTDLKMVKRVARTRRSSRLPRNAGGPNALLLNMARMGVDMMLKQQFKDGDDCYQMSRQVADDVFAIAPDVIGMVSTLNCFGGNVTASSESAASQAVPLNLVDIFLKLLTP